MRDLARLRMSVFRDWPYIYDGDETYEHKYLQRYVTAKDAAVVLASAGDRVVGASTCLPLLQEMPAVQQAFIDSAADLHEIFYFGESVLDREYRGQGIGVAFFAAREAQARKTGYGIATFCAVQRPADHPLRPADAVPLDAFWGKRGYVRQPHLHCKMRWRDLNQTDETEKDLVFWTKDLRS